MNTATPNPSSQSKKNLFRTVVTNLTFWVLIAIICGILLGHFSPANSVKMEFLGKKFIQLISLFIGPIIFLTIVLGISGMGNLKKVGRIGVKALTYFEVVSTVALAIGVAVAYIFKPGKIDKSGLTFGDASQYTNGADEGFFLVAILFIQFYFTGFTCRYYLRNCFEFLSKKGANYFGFRTILKSGFLLLKICNVSCSNWCFWRNGLHYW